MSLKPFNEEFDRAYANVGLLASDIWCYRNEELNYKKANLNLWIRFNETEKRLIDDDSSDDLSTSTEAIYTVQDILPFSRLATYGNFEYNEQREKMYVVDDGVSSPKYTTNSRQSNHEELEVWMLPEVEKEFKRYSKSSHSGWCTLSSRYPSGRELVSIRQITNSNPHKWLSETQWQTRLLSHYAEKLPYLKLSNDISIFRNDLEPPVYDDEEVETKLLDYPFPRYMIDRNVDQRLHDIIDSPTIRNIWATPGYRYGSYSQTFGLNAEVAEFQPITYSSKLEVEGECPHPMITTQNSIQHRFVDGFATNESVTGARQHYVSIFDMNYEAEVFPYTNMNRYFAEPQTVFFEFNEVIQQSSGVADPYGLHFNMEFLRSKWNKQQDGSSTDIATLCSSGEQVDRNQNAEKIMAWVTKIYSPRSTDFDQINSLSNKINIIFQDLQEGYCLVQSDLDSVAAATKRESQFDKLEQEALEQYSGSDTVIPTTLHIVQQVCLGGEVNANEESPMGNSKDLEGIPLSSALPSSSPERDSSSLDGPFICLPEDPVQFTVLGKKLINEVEPKFEATLLPNMQAKWTRKKNKKYEKKRRNIKRNKKKVVVEHNIKFVESEILMINKFFELSNTFNLTFFHGCWKLVQDQLTEPLQNIFERCLNMFGDCTDWFMFLTQNFSQDCSKPKKRIDLLKKVVSLSENVLIALQQYVALYNQIKMTIPCDHRLYFTPETLGKQRSIMTHKIDAGSLFDQVVLPNAIYNSKYSSGLLISDIKKERPSKAFNHEWNLKNFLEMPTNRKHLQIKILLKECQIRVSVSETESEEPKGSMDRKLVKILEDCPTWSSYQWKFIEGWKLDFKESSFLPDRLNRFNVKVLEQAATSESMLFMIKWFDSFTKAAVSRKKYPSCEVLWNRKTPNLVSSKMVFFRLLLQNEKGWYFGDVRINQTACCDVSFGCENPCCVSWMLNYHSESPIAGSIVPESEKVTTKSKSTKAILKKYCSKSKKYNSPESTSTFKDIQEHCDKIILPPEKSTCVVQ